MYYGRELMSSNQKCFYFIYPTGDVFSGSILAFVFKYYKKSRQNNKDRRNPKSDLKPVPPKHRVM
jgi:hypothetical protein